MSGEPAPPGELLPWEWARRRLAGARDYWGATTRPGGRPHCRPVWGVWLHLESGQEVVIVEGAARMGHDAETLREMCAVYGPKYDYPISPREDGTVVDASGTGGPAFHVVPEVVFGWGPELASPTRWRF
ncbi:hypothetical protein [Amycolatopsis albispora]|nr:hypothetical protein [Amycolatopsis albispora]